MILELALVLHCVATLLAPEAGDSRALAVLGAVWGSLMLVGWAMILKQQTGRVLPAFVPVWGDALVLERLGYTGGWWLVAWLFPPSCAVLRIVVPAELVTGYRLSLGMFVCLVLLPPIGLILLGKRPWPAMQTRLRLREQGT